MPEGFSAMSKRYFSSRMQDQIVKNSVVGSGLHGRGLFARRNLPRGAIVGYYTGPIFTWNNQRIFIGQDDYIAGGQFIHPGSKKKMSYHVLVVGPTRFMNHGHCRDYYEGSLPDHGVLANVQMLPEKMRKIAERFRPVWEFKTVVSVKKGEELFYDYGVHDDEIYYEMLRRNRCVDGHLVRRKYKSIIKRLRNRYSLRWAQNQEVSWHNDSDLEEQFFLALLIRFLNSPERCKIPTKNMILPEGSE